MAKKPVPPPEDLAGLKLRAPTAVTAAIVKALGGTPVTLAAPETYNALERGVIDGTLFPWEAISGFKLAEVLRHHTAVNLYAASLFMTMNQKKYESLPPDLRKVIDDLSGAWGAEFTGAAWDKNEEEGMAAAKNAGATIYAVPAAERARWAAKLKPVEDEWITSMQSRGLPGREVLQDLREALQRYDRRPAPAGVGERAQPRGPTRWRRRSAASSRASRPAVSRRWRPSAWRTSSAGTC